MIHVYSVESHDTLKEDIFNIIESMKVSYDLTEPAGFKTKSNSVDAYRSPGHITYADYFNEKFKKEQPYRSIIEDAMAPYVQQVCDMLYCNAWTFKGMWYHEYHKGDSFEWHTHQNSHMTGLYYLDGCEPTELLGPYTLDAKEGDVVFMPSMIPHRAPQSEHKRSVIAWTMNFHYYEHTDA